MNTIPDYIEIILTDLDNQRATQHDLDLLVQWIKQHPNNQQALHEYQKVQNLLQQYNSKNCYNIDMAWNQLLQKIGKRKYNTTYTWLNKAAYSWYAKAALLAIAFIGGALATHLLHNQQLTDIENQQLNNITIVAAPKGSITQVILPDSTTAWINADSKLAYNADYNLKNRNVTLHGEAFFNVTKNKKLPFIVNTNIAQFKALGTTFNVKAYAQDPTVELTVESGRVQILGDHNIGNSGILQPNQHATLLKSTNELTIDKVNVQLLANTQIFTSWKDEQWIFQQESLAQLANKLERRFNVVIAFADSTLMQYTFSGTILNEPLCQTLDYVKNVANVDYDIQHQHINIKHVNNKRKQNDVNSLFHNNPKLRPYVGKSTNPQQALPTVKQAKPNK
jgi:ferric-dicitrate binding protein FerR (iron transport regulator)